jgi:hypothetical protein
MDVIQLRSRLATADRHAATALQRSARGWLAMVTLTIRAVWIVAVVLSALSIASVAGAATWTSLQSGSAVGTIAGALLAGGPLVLAGWAVDAEITDKTEVDDAAE